MKIKNLIMLLIAVAFITIASTIAYYSFFVVVHVEQSPYSFNVRNGAGLVGDRDAVKFGSAGPGGTASRFIIFNNRFDFPVKVRIKIKGDKEEWIIPYDNNFILEPADSKEIKITVYIPEDAEYHYNYTGIVTAQYLKIW